MIGNEGRETVVPFDRRMRRVSRTELGEAGITEHPFEHLCLELKFGEEVRQGSRN